MPAVATAPRPVNVVWRPNRGGQKVFLRLPYWEVLAHGNRGGGKALAIDTPIPTPSGWSTMEQIGIGDQVFDERGSPCNVLAISDIMPNREVYEVCFSDGQTIFADAEHLWATTTCKEKQALYHRSEAFRVQRRLTRGRKFQAVRQYSILPPPPLYGIRSTEEIAQTLLAYSRELNHYITLASALELPECVLPIDPYILGVWLGDGRSNAGSITTADREIIEALAHAGYCPQKQSGLYAYGTRGLTKQLRGIGALKNKHIPICYLRASIPQRLGLLQGLMDTDGYVDVRGKCEFTTTNDRLAFDMHELLTSLGIKNTIAIGRAQLYGKDCGMKFRLVFYPSFPVFRLTRKLKRQKFVRRPTTTRRYIVDVRLVETRPVKCIVVDSSSHLYLAGRGMIPTHNSDALLMDYGQHVGRGFGSAWRGVLFRRTYKQLEDIVQRSKRWYPRIFPGAKFNESEYHWTFPEGEELLLRYIWSKNDYEHYHGHELPYIGWEELSNWPTQECYDLMKSCSRSSVPGMPRKIRGTTNSYGVGHAWLKEYFIDPAPPLVSVGPPGLQRTHVIMDLEQNAPFLAADPEYLLRLEAIEDENLRKAWRYGSWDVVSGAFFADVWNAKVHVLPPFHIPQHWRIDRSHDWGESRPFCTLWFAESNGEAVETAQGVKQWPKGTVFVIAEDYGWNGKPNEGLRLPARQIAQRVKEAERAMGYVVHPGPADLPAMQNGQSVEADMAQMGVRWEKPQKGPGSRVTGWSALRGRLAASLKHPMEEPGLFIFDTCRHVIRTLPVLPRDEKDPDDLATDSEDHVADTLRLRVAVRDMKMAVGRMRV